MLRNGKLSDILAELQTLLKEKSGEQGTDGEHADALATQVRRLAMEVRQLASARPITVLNGSGGQSGNFSSLLVPAATVGALGYGYMWWKGLSFSDLMYVTKQNMSNAVSSMTKHLDQVSAALAATKKHLTQRIENLDGKMDEQKAISSEIKNEVIDARDKLTDIGYNLNSLQQLVWGLDGKVNAIETKQDFACAGVMYLCKFVEGKDGNFANFLQDGPKTARRGFLGPTETRSLKGLQHITEAIESGNFDKSKAEEIFQNDINALQGLSRSVSIR